MEIKNRHHLRDDEVKEIKRRLKNCFGEDILGDKKLEKGEIDDNEVVLVDGKPLLSKFNNSIFPNVLGALELNLEKRKSLIVDQGAVSHVINGADIMAPGVVEVDKEIKKNDLAIVRENEHNKALAIVKSLFDSQKILEMEKGKVAVNQHHLRDDFWKKISD